MGCQVAALRERLNGLKMDAIDVRPVGAWLENDVPERLQWW